MSVGRRGPIRFSRAAVHRWRAPLRCFPPADRPGRWGQIVGGGETHLDCFTSPGAVATWNDYVTSSLPDTLSYGIEANVFVDFED